MAWVGRSALGEIQGENTREILGEITERNMRKNTRAKRQGNNTSGKIPRELERKIDTV